MPRARCCGRPPRYSPHGYVPASACPPARMRWWPCTSPAIPASRGPGAADVHSRNCWSCNSGCSRCAGTRSTRDAHACSAPPAPSPMRCGVPCRSPSRTSRSACCGRCAGTSHASGPCGACCRARWARARRWWPHWRARRRWRPVRRPRSWCPPRRWLSSTSAPCATSSRRPGWSPSSSPAAFPGPRGSAGRWRWPPARRRWWWARRRCWWAACDSMTWAWWWWTSSTGSAWSSGRRSPTRQDRAPMPLTCST